MTRTPDEIVARIREIRSGDGDFFGFRFEQLLVALDFDHAREWLKPDATPDGWERLTDLDEFARGYLTFAIGKIIDHRGISAGRSVDKLGELAWLLGRDDVVAAMAEADYPQYGAPQVKAFALGMGWSDLWTADDPVVLNRMARGETCEPDCGSGCGT